MKFIKGIAFFFLLSLLISSCEEVGPNIILGGNPNLVSISDSTESPVASAEVKNVVIEEFTGVRCPNCPQGHQIIKDIKTQHGDRAISVSLHPVNSLGAKYPFSTDDFTNPKAQSLFDYLVQIGLEPAAAIDRKQYTGETKVLLDKSKWAARVTEETGLTTPVNLLLSTTFNSASRELRVTVEMHYTQNVSEENKLTLLLTESDIVTAQLNGSIIDTFYTHKDVMRDFISDVQGDAITTTRVAGRIEKRVYKKVLPAAWNEDNVYVVGCIHEYKNAKIIYQGKEVKATN